jgi:hypothetical protein
VAHEHAEPDERDEADEDEAGHPRPFARGEVHPERDAGRVQDDDRDQRKQVGDEHLGAEVGPRGERRQPQLPVPAGGALLEMRVPVESTVFIVPNAVMPIM